MDNNVAEVPSLLPAGPSATFDIDSGMCLH